MKSDGLLSSGFEYIVIDDGWAMKDRDAAGRMQADPIKFPQGIKWLADHLHDLGFKFGIYTSVGSVTCGGGQPGIMDHHQIDAETFAAWDVDYVPWDMNPRGVYGFIYLNKSYSSIGYMTLIGSYTLIRVLVV